MRYPNFIKKNDTVGILATSCGNNKNPYRIRIMEGIKAFENLGFKVKRGHRLFRQSNAVSAPHDIRAKDFNLMYKNKNIDMLWSTGGGEIMMGMLPMIDFDKMKKLPPKYFVGFSDNTNLTFTITTICDVATIYGTGCGCLSRTPKAIDSDDLVSLMTGEKLSFDSYELYDDLFTKRPKLSSLERYEYSLPVEYKSLANKEKEHIEGRLIGGCLDILVCLCGTKFDNVKNFIEKYKDEGIVWYFDVCDLNSCGFYRALFQLQEAGWFKYVKGFIIGRPLTPIEPMGYTFLQAMKDILTDYNVPVIYDVDISHIPPALPIINGSYAKFDYDNHKGHIEFILK